MGKAGVRVTAAPPLGHVLAQDRRGERPERLAPLDLEVEDVFHVGTARVAEDAATVLATMGLTVPDAFRIMLTRMARGTADA